MTAERKRDYIDVNPNPLCRDEQKDGLWGAEPNCDGRVIAQPGGGVKCNKCGGWFCY